MNSTDDVKRVYDAIVDDVIRDAEIEFENDGLDSVLVDTLRELWLQKLNEGRLGPALGDVTEDAEEALEAADELAAISDVYGGAEARTAGRPTLPAALGDDSLGNKHSAQPSSVSASAFSSSASAAATAAAAAGAAAAAALRTRDLPPQLDGPAGDDEVAISDLNDGDDVDDDEDDEDQPVSNKLLCTFEKVQRNRDRWKIALRDGIIEVDGREYVFQRGNADLDFAT